MRAKRRMMIRSEPKRRVGARSGQLTGAGRRRVNGLPPVKLEHEAPCRFCRGPLPRQDQGSPWPVVKWGNGWAHARCAEIVNAGGRVEKYTPRTGPQRIRGERSKTGVSEKPGAARTNFTLRAACDEACSICGGLIQKGTYFDAYGGKHAHIRCVRKALRGDLQREGRDTDNRSRDEPRRESRLIVNPDTEPRPVCPLCQQKLPKSFQWHQTEPWGNGRAHLRCAQAARKEGHVPITEAPAPEVSGRPLVLSVSESLPLAPGELFAPKDSSDYVASLTGRVIVKSRSHERLVRDFGEWGQAHGLQPSTPHPRDLVLKSPDREWLIEAKVVYDGNAADAARAAIGQLMDYRHFLYTLPGLPAPALLALFSEPIGDQYAGLLASLSIAPVWRAGDNWGGSLPALETSPLLSSS